MSLKEQVPNVYGVGINSVGSYRVSGVPHISQQTISSGGENKIEFPYVTKDVTFTKTTLGDDARIHFASKGGGHVMKALAMRDNNTDTIADQLFRVTKNLAPPFSFNMWFRAQQAHGAGMQFSLWETTSFPIMNAKVMYQGSMYNIRTTVKDQTNQAYGINHNISAAQYDNLGWHAYTLVVDSIGAAHYLDGNNIAINGTSVGDMTFPTGRVLNSNFAGIFFPQRFSQMMEVTNLTIWNKRLTSVEANELYNNGNFLDPTTHSAATNLQHWYRMDDTLTPADTNTQVFDRVGSLNADLPNQVPGKINQPNISAEYVTGPSGWVSGSGNTPNTITGGHYLTLTDARPSVTLRCKCAEVYLSAPSNSQTVQVTANLTNIPASKMFALTGSGIDE